MISWLTNKQIVIHSQPFTVLSSPYTSSPTAALNIASNISLFGFVIVSLRRSISLKSNIFRALLYRFLQQKLTQVIYRKFCKQKFDEKIDAKNVLWKKIFPNQDLLEFDCDKSNDTILKDEIKLQRFIYKWWKVII